MSFNLVQAGNGLNGNVWISNLTLQAVGNAGDKTPLSITINTLSDSTEGAIIATPINGTFSIKSYIITSVSIDDASAAHGETTTAMVMVNNVTDLANFDITVSYDPSVVNVTGAVNNPKFGTNLNNLEHAGEGWVRLVSFNLVQAGDGLNGNIWISNLTLQAVGNTGDKTPLSITINTLPDSTEGAITATPINGTFTISETPISNGTLVGLVSDSTNEHGIAGATVTAGGLNTITDSLGKYNMSLAPGTYDVTVNASGYQDNTASGVVIISNIQTVQNFHLIPTIIANISLENISTSAVADNTDKFEMLLTAKDNNGNVINGAKFDLHSNRTQDTIVPGTVTTNETGVATFYVKSTKAGIAKITVNGTNYGKVNLTNSNVLFVPGPAYKLAIFGPDSVTGVKTMNQIIAVQDVNGNNVTSDKVDSQILIAFITSGNAIITSINPLAITGENATNIAFNGINYSATYNSYFTITAYQVGAGSVTFGANSNKVNGATKTIHFYNSISSLKVDVNKTSMKANGGNDAILVTVTLKDINRNDVKTDGVEITLGSPTPELFNTSDISAINTTNSSGVTKFVVRSSTMIGSGIIRATVTYNPAGGTGQTGASDRITLIPSQSDLATISVLPISVKIHKININQTFTAKGYDSNGNEVFISPTWNSSNTSIGTIDNSGIFTPTGTTGTTTISATDGSVTGTATVTVLIGDINGDGTVNFTDLGMLGATYGLSEEDTGYNSEADLNNDGTVNFTDLGLLGLHYGESI